MISKAKSNWLKLVGIVTMIIDHLGYFFFPAYTFLRIIGRIAFPIFAFQIGIGYKNTHDFKKYALRLSGLAIISQIPFYLLRVHRLNTIFTLLLGLGLIYLYDKKKYYFLPLILAFPFFIPLDYGIYGLLVILLFYIFQEQPVYIIISQTILLFTTTFFFQIYSLLAIPIIFGRHFNIKLPKYTFYYFYPGHLLIIYLIKEFLMTA